VEEAIIIFLEGLANGTIEPIDTMLGLCSCLSEEGLKIPEMRQIMENWDSFSGSALYPVPDPAGELDACTKYQSTSDMWGGEYGKLRKELCQYLADHIKENGLP